ncbi:MAG: cell division protein FtsZ [Rhodospirillales bacterium]|nr:cell division protein FtsZ [Rhodospirillales bacterium]
MTINLSVPNNTVPELKPRIVVIGVGGAGGNAVNNMIDSGLEGVEFLVANTDAQALAQSRADRKIQLGEHVSQGLGAGSRPEIGRAAAEESLDQILEDIKGINMAFIAAGMGGGTGTGAAPVIAQAAREQGILTVGVVTKPFQFEGIHRMRIAEDGIEDLEQYVDTLIIIPNQNLFRIANEKTTFADAFKMADDVLHSGVRGVTDLMIMPGLINLDFADIRTVMSEMGRAMMGTGEAEGERRALDAAEAAIANPLLDDSSMKGAKGVLINIVGGSDMTLFEVDEAANRIRSEVDADAYINFGSIFDPDMEGRIRVSVVATGINSVAQIKSAPTTLHVDGVKAPETQKPAQAFALPRGLPQGLPQGLPKTAVKPEPSEVRAESAPVERELFATADQAAPTAAAEPGIAKDTDGKENGSAAISSATEADSKSEVELGTAPTASPAVHNHDAFIPPPPAERIFGSAAKPADPFAAAAMTNGSGEAASDNHNRQGKLKGPSLFERVTGTGRAARVETSKPDPILGVAVQSAHPAESVPLHEQVALGGLDPEERISEPQREDDLLDIPAFLRRQAN